MSKAEDFVGMSKKGAQNKAEAENLIFRLISVDGVSFLKYPTELDPPEEPRTDRICVEIENSKVVKARFE